MDVSAVIDNFTDSSPENGKSSKRRSAVFKRRSILSLENEDSTNLVDNGGINHKSKKIKLFDENKKLKEFNLKTYIELLEKEASEWREEYKKRKLRVHDLSKRVENLEKVGQYLDICCLTDPEKAFIALKPDYKDFNKNIFQLHALAIKVSYLNLHAANFCNRSSSKLKNGMNKTIHRIIKLED